MQHIFIYKAKIVTFVNCVCFASVNVVILIFKLNCVDVSFVENNLSSPFNLIKIYFQILISQVRIQTRMRTYKKGKAILSKLMN